MFPLFSYFSLRKARSVSTALCEMCAKIVGTYFLDCARANDAGWFNPVPGAVRVKVIYQGLGIRADNLAGLF